MCVADIKFANTVKVPDDYVKLHLTKAVDTRCTNVIISLYNMTTTPNQIEDYVGTDEIRKNKFETMKLGIALFVEVVKITGGKPFPIFKKAWEQITNPKPDKSNTI